MASDPTDDLKEQIRYLKDVEGLSFHQIEGRTGLSRKRAARLYAGSEKKETISSGLLLDPYRPLIASWFASTPSLKSIQVWKRLRERGVAVGYRTVSEYTETFRKKKKEKVYWPLTFTPGEEGQVDWFVVFHPRLGKLWGCALILSYSRYAWARLFPRSSFEFFIAGHLAAFQDFGGCPHALRYDNLKSVVLKREPLTYNPAFLEFARHYGFEIRLCNVRAGNEKGRVERLIRSIRDTFLNVSDTHQSLDALNAGLKEWMREKNDTLHRATEAVPREKKKEEKLKPLPIRPWRNVLIHLPQPVTKTGLVAFDSNLYSIPSWAAHEPVTLHISTDRVEIYDLKGRRLASHPRAFGRKETLLNPLHRSPSRLSDAAKRERIFALIRNMDPVLKTFLEKNAQAGEDPFATAYLFFKLLKDHSRETLLSCAREAITAQSCRLKYLLERLRREDVGEPVHPQNPSLLTLDYQPRPLEDYDHS